MPSFRSIAPNGDEVSSSSWLNQWTPKEQVDLDGVIYDICVAKHDGRFLAVSVCNDCCEQVSINLGSSTAKKAREQAMVGLELHHNSVHRPVRKPR
jgi:hypothetical protein